MRTRLLALVSVVAALSAGCADNVTDTAPAPATSAFAPSVPASSSPLPSAPAVGSAPSASGGESISGTVSAGIEPHCLVLQDAKGSHVLVFHDSGLRDAAPAGARVTLVGHSEPKMMTTCQQGVVFVVTAVRRD